MIPFSSLFSAANDTPLLQMQRAAKRRLESRTIEQRWKGHLNEPETSLHPDLLPPLARLIAQASGRSQIIVVTHSAALIEALAQSGGNPIRLEKQFGETMAVTDDERPAPRWHWPSR
jgi:predicted ATPase